MTPGKCRIVASTKTLIATGTQSLSSETAVMFEGVRFTVPAGTVLDVAGFQIPTTPFQIPTTPLSAPRLKYASLSSLSVIRGAVEVKASLTPVLTGIVQAPYRHTFESVCSVWQWIPHDVAKLIAEYTNSATIVVLGNSPVCLDFANTFQHTVENPSNHHWTSVECLVNPVQACFEDTRLETTTTPEPMNVCVANTFHQFDVVQACLR